MNASLLQAFMDQLMNLLLAAVALIVGGITAMAVIDSAPRMARWGYANILSFFGLGEDKNWTITIERDGKTYEMPGEFMSFYQHHKGYEVFDGPDKDRIYMRKPQDPDIHHQDPDMHHPVGTTEDDFEIDGDFSYLEDHQPNQNINSYEFLKHDSTDYDDDEPEPITNKGAA